MKRKAPTQKQILHVNRMFLDGSLSREQFREFNQMATEGALTFEVAKAIIEGTFKFKYMLFDVHLAKVRRVYEKLAKPVFGLTFAKYLNGTDGLEGIPLVKVWPERWMTAFDRDVLVDGRIVDKIGLSETSRLSGLIYTGDDNTFVPHDEARVENGVRWMRAEPGRKNRNRKPIDCRSTFAADETGLDAAEGVFTYVDDFKVIEGHYMDLVASVRRGLYACLGVVGGRPELDWRWDGVARPRYGAASRGSATLKP